MILSSEITTTTSYGRQNIKSCIQNHIVCRTMMDWGSYRINHFKSDHLPNISLKHFIDGERNTGLFDCLKLWEHPVNTLIRAFPNISAVVHCQDIACHSIENYIYLLPHISPPINIISSFPVFTFLQYNWWAAYYSSHSIESHILYEDSAVLPSEKLELFRTAILK